MESCVQLAGFSVDALLMDRHRAPAMSRDSICFGVNVDGVCAVVGCNRSKHLAALEAVKVTLDAAGLQCSEVEADTAWRWKPLASGGCDVVWSLLHWSSMEGIASRALSDHEAGGYGPQSPRNSAGLRHYCRFSLAILPVLGRHGFTPRTPRSGARGGVGVTSRKCDPETVAAAGSCAERWRFSAEEFISTRRSVLIENERKLRKPLGLESWMYPKVIV